MTRSLATLARAALSAAGVARGERVLLACSGGVDSQVLVDVMAHVADELGLSLVAHGVDHGLRAAATDELDLADALCRDRGVPFARTRVSLAPGSNLQARARAARHAALEAARIEQGATRTATAHHLDDRAETVLLRLFRGAPLRALGVLPEAAGVLLRPLVRARRSAIEAHARGRGLRWAEDPSNADLRGLRARVRHELLPRMREVDPRIEEHLAAWADEALALPAEPDDPVDRGVLERLSREGRPPSARALEAIRDAVRAKNREARVLLPGGRVARWDEVHGIVITPETDERPSHDVDDGRSRPPR